MCPVATDSFAFSKVLYKCDHTVFTFLCLASFLHPMILRFIHVAVSNSGSFLFLLKEYFLDGYTTIYLSICQLIAVGFVSSFL